MPACANQRVLCVFVIASFLTWLFVCVLPAMSPSSSQAIFKPCSLHRAVFLLLSHFLICLRSNVNPELRHDRLFSLPRALTPVNQSLLLAEMSATIKVSPVGGVMPLKGFACLLETGWGNTLACHTCQLKAPLNPWADSPERNGLFTLNEYFREMMQRYASVCSSHWPGNGGGFLLH